MIAFVCLPARFDFQRRLKILAAAAAFCCAAAALHGGFLFAQNAPAPEAYKWSVQYLIDNSQTVFGRSQKLFPRNNRGLAISPDGRFLYASYLHSFGGSGEVRKIDLRVADYENATLQIAQRHAAKAVAVDDEGRVYLAEGSAIHIMDADLTRTEFSIGTATCDGVAVTREWRSLVLYATDRHRNTLTRYVLQTSGKNVTGASPEGLGENGEMPIEGARGLRGAAVDSRGRIWMADLDGGSVFRIDHNGKNLASVRVHNATAIAFDGERAFVTRFTDREIAIIDAEMNVVGTLNVPWEELELASAGNNHNGALSGIVVVPAGRGFYVSNEAGQTANQKSTYGRTDDNSDIIGGKVYKDAFQDDNDPILHALPVAATEAVPVANPAPPGG